VSPTHGEQENSVWNGHYACTCYHPLFVFNQFGDLERCALRPGNVHSVDGWQSVLTPVVERYKGKVSRIYFRPSAATTYRATAERSAAFLCKFHLSGGKLDKAAASLPRLNGIRVNFIRGSTSPVRLSYLAPDIVRALLAGSQSNALTPSRLLRLSKNLPHDWKEQRCFLGFAA